MAERILWLSPHWIPLESEYETPAIGSALRTLGQHFDLDFVRWPGVKGAPEAAPRWEAAVEVLAAATDARSHLFAAPGETSIALLALSRGSEAKSLIAGGLAIPDATLEKLGIRGMAAVSQASYQSGPFSRQMTRGLRAVSPKAAQIADALVDWDYIEEYQRSWESLDLLAESPHVTVPCLYIDPSPDTTQYPEGEDKQLFLRFVPGAEITTTERWGLGPRLRDPEAGEELAALAISFIDRLAAGTRLLTVLFTDIVDSTVHALELGDQRWARLLADHHALVRRELAAHGGHEVDNAGDGFLVTFESPARAVRCAAAIVTGVRRLGIDVRAGIHTGECEIVGEKVGGVAVHAGARIAASARPGEVLASRAVRDLVSAPGLEFGSARTVELKGLPGEWELHPLSLE